MNSNEKVVMAVVALVALTSVAIAVYYAFFHKCKVNCPLCVCIEPVTIGVLKAVGSGKFLMADGTLISDATQATAFQISMSGMVSPAIESINWVMTTVDGVSVLHSTDKQLGSIVMDVSKSPVGAKPQSVMAGLHDADCQLI